MPRYNEFFRIGDGAARLLPPTAKGIPGGNPQWGDVYVVYNPLEKQNFTVRYGFAADYQSTKYPETGGKTVAEVFGPPIGNDGDAGGGRSYQHFHRGYFTWTQAEGIQVHLDFPAGDGWARKLPSSWNAIPGDQAAWGDQFWVFNPKLNQRLTVKYGYAQVYDSTAYPETNGKPLYAVLGPPRENEKSDGADGSLQEFEGGTLSWNPRDGNIRLTLRAPAGVDGPAGEKKAMRPLSLQEIAALSGKELSKKKTPRLRIAPSPTGYLHIGNAWIAVINYLMAKKLGGEFKLRIEDTDPLRSKPEYTEVIKDSLKWLGISWEGEVVFQSQRSELYQAKVKQLIAEGKAYKDPKTGAVFFKMPETGPLVVHDRVKGRVEVPISADEQGKRDIMLLRSDGSPMFLLANTIDDGEQGITHVIRGEGHLLNAALQAQLFKALGYEVPEFYHLPHIVGETGAKLSKREGASSVLDFKARGIDPEVVLSHLAGLGMKGASSETKTIEQLIAGFDRLAFMKAPSRMGMGALLEKSKKHIAAMDSTELRKKLEAFDPTFMAELGRAGAVALAEAVKNRASTYEEAIRIGKFVRAEPKYAEKAARVNVTAESKQQIGDVLARLRALKSWSLGELRGALQQFNQDRGVKYRAYAEALQWMLTGDSEGIPLEHTLAILGRDESIRRLDAALAGNIQLSASPPEAPKAPAKAKKADPGPAARAKEPALTGAKLTLYLKYAKHLGAPIEEAQPAASGWQEQRFERGLAGDHGQIQIYGRPFWLVGGKLDTYLKYRDAVGDATGEAYQDPPGSNVWVQKFDRALVCENGQLRFDDHQYWLTNGKLDAWLKARELLGKPTGEAYYPAATGVWQQDFEQGQTDDHGAVRLKAAPFWMVGGKLDAFLANREKLGLPVGEAYQNPAGEWVQDFQHGQADDTGAIRLKQPDPPAADKAKLTEGALVQEEGQPAVYTIAGGAKLHIPNPDVFNRMGYNWNTIIRLAPGTLREVPAVPADGTLVREADRPEVYLMRNGSRCHIPDEATFYAMGFNFADVKVVPDASLAQVPQAVL